MSIMLHVQDGLHLTRQALGRLFGICIEKTREAGGRSVEEAARLAGMAASQWEAIEAGYVPADSTQLRSMASALELSFDKIARLAMLFGDALKEVRPIKKKEGTGIKRVNINVEINLHNAFKAATAAQGVDMTTVLIEFIQEYVARNGLATPRKSRRA
jgi:hypothetical protein